MATYAAFKHVELYNVGKTKKRVLRPPGGGSSDIFGTDTPSTPRSVRNHMASNIFGSTQDASVKNNVDSARRGAKNADSYNRLFGEPERPFTPAKNHMRSNIPIGSEGEKLKSQNGSSSIASTTNGHGDKNGKAENGGTTVHHHIAVEQNGVSKTEFEEIQVSKENCPTDSRTPSPRVAAESNREQNAIKNANKDNNLPLTNGHANDSSITNKNNNIICNGDTNGTDNTNNNNCKDSSCDSTTTTTSTSSSTVSPATSNSSNKSANSARSPRFGSRNPVTGIGIDMPNERLRRVNHKRDGNPVTGEGYKPAGAEINTTIPCLNGANQVINKNRIPPGGYSSGLW